MKLVVPSAERQNVRSPDSLHNNISLKKRTGRFLDLVKFAQMSRMGRFADGLEIAVGEDIESYISVASESDSGANGTEEIAYLLGYQDTSSFYRAFREWEGITPRQWRDANQVGAKMH